MTDGLTARTTIPSRDAAAPRTVLRRALGGVRRDDVVNLGGAATGAVCTGLLMFGRLTPLDGPLGFVIVTYLVFLGIYAFILSATDERPAVVDKLVNVLLATAAAVAGLALFSVVFFIVLRGAPALYRVNLYTQDMRRAGPADPLSVGGIKHAIVGTLIIIAIAVAITVPLGLTCAVFLNETRSRAATLVRTVVDAMTALPSILAGLFVFATWILVLGFERSALAAAFSVSVVMLPIMIRASDVVLRLVPGNLREASAALGAPQWRTVWHVVLPTARPGLATAVILGIARGVGETAPVLLTAGVTATVNFNPLKNPMVPLPLATFLFVLSPQPAMRARGFATAAVLMVVVLVLFATARLVGGRQSHQVTGRAAKRAASRSARDVARFDRRGPREAA